MASVFDEPASMCAACKEKSVRLFGIAKKSPNGMKLTKHYCWECFIELAFGLIPRYREEYSLGGTFSVSSDGVFDPCPWQENAIRDLEESR